MDKKGLSEADICDQFITPAVQRAGWDSITQIRREHYFTDGQVLVRGRMAARGKRNYVDYLLSHRPGLPIAILEAKDNTQAVGAGMGQALRYAEALDVPFVFSSNGDAFLFHDRTGQSLVVEQELTLDQFPSPAELWQRYRRWRGLDGAAEQIAEQPFHQDLDGKEPRYYQRAAVQRVVEAIARGDRRLLLVMATGTGKTYTAFQILWRLWKAKVAKRILFLADRNILVDQTIQNDFKPFGSVMKKVENRLVDTSYEVYLALYQAVTGSDEEKQIYRQFSPDFFDLVVIDECHRGSAREQSAWREVLDWFAPAVQLGMTATPKETRQISTLTYFGEPIYTYSLRQGIADGFLAPYKVVRIDLDKDLQGWRPTVGQRDDLGQEIDDRIYNSRDMDRSLVLVERTRRVAEKVVEYLAGTDPYGKTIVFCETIEHAARMRTALVNAVARRFPAERLNTKFVAQITGDNDEGKRLLDDFLHPERRYPVIATTSKLLSTGVDAKTCKLVVLDQRIESMIEFKQIIGRGTRLHPDAGKLWFTIMDFKKATELFADPDFDGDPVVVYEPATGSSPVPPELSDQAGAGTQPESPSDSQPARRFFVSNVPVSIAAERVQFYSADGRLVTESLRDYTRAAVQQKYHSLDEWLAAWRAADKKVEVMVELERQGVPWEDLRDHAGKDLDPFDLVCHVVYDRPPLTRRERADQVRKRDVFAKYGVEARAVLDALLDKYAEEGPVTLEDPQVLRVKPLADLGTAIELMRRFGGPDLYREAVRELENEIYRPAS
ncbi:MAG: DEAD/DEAH box helicase family protein [Planctomycetota bacterium]